MLKIRCQKSKRGVGKDNMLQMVVASILEKKLSEIPDFKKIYFEENQTIDVALEKALDIFGYSYVLWFEKSSITWTGLYIVLGLTKKGFNHCEVYENGKSIYNPYRHRGSIQTVRTTIGLVPYDPIMIRDTTYSIGIDGVDVTSSSYTLRACLAQLLNIQLKEIPEFHNLHEPEWFDQFYGYLNSIGYTVACYQGVRHFKGFTLQVGYTDDHECECVLKRDEEMYYNPSRRYNSLSRVAYTFMLIPHDPVRPGEKLSSEKVSEGRPAE